MSVKIRKTVVQTAAKTQLVVTNVHVLQDTKLPNTTNTLVRTSMNVHWDYVLIIVLMYLVHLPVNAQKGGFCVRTPHATKLNVSMDLTCLNQVKPDMFVYVPKVMPWI